MGLARAVDCSPATACFGGGEGDLGERRGGRKL
jgi:hypothetical protein